MNAPTVFAAPDPIAVSVHSDLSRGEVIQRLEQAVRGRPYSKPDRFSPGFFRLGGVVTSERVTLTARPYATPGLIAGYGKMTFELRGEVASSDDGSEICGIVSAPVKWTTPAFMALALVAWVAFGVAGNGSTWPTWTFIVVGSLMASGGARRRRRYGMSELSPMHAMWAGLESRDAAVVASADGSTIELGESPLARILPAWTVSRSSVRSRSGLRSLPSAGRH